MNAKKLGSKKALKFLGLLVSAMVIATVSAATYRYMFIDGSVIVGTEKLVWIKGSDAPASATITGSTVTMPIDVEPGTLVNLTYCLYLENQDTAAHNMTISVTQAVAAGDFNTCAIHIYENATTTFVDTLDLTNSADTYETYSGNDPIAQNEVYRMAFEVYPKTNATGTYNFDIQVEYE